MGLAGLAANLIGDARGVMDRRQMAEMAASRFDQIGGDQADYWARSLRANPRLALKMAEHYGGVGGIETKLRGSQARGRAVEAQDRGASQSEMLDALFQQNPETASKYAEMLQRAAQGGHYDAQARGLDQRAEMMQRLTGSLGGAPQGGPTSGQGRPQAPGQYPGQAPEQGQPQGQPPVGGAEPHPMGGYEHWLSLPQIAQLGLIDPRLSVPQLAVREDGRESTNDAIEQGQRAARPLVARFNKTVSDFSLFRNADYTNPANDAALVKQFVGQVEPGLQVTTAEGESVIEAAESSLGAIGQRILRALVPAGRFTPETRRSMIEWIDAAANDRMTNDWAQIEALRGRYTGIPGFPNAPSRVITGESASRTKMEELIANPIQFDEIGRKVTTSSIAKILKSRAGDADRPDGAKGIHVNPDTGKEKLVVWNAKDGDWVDP